MKRRETIERPPLPLPDQSKRPTSSTRKEVPLPPLPHGKGNTTDSVVSERMKKYVDDCYQMAKSLRSQLYYHPNLKTKEEVKEYMLKATPGEFLLRDSFTEPGSFTFSIMHNTGLKHIKLECHEGTSLSLRDRRFSTIEELVNFYIRHNIENRDNLSDVILTKPICRERRAFIKTSSDDRSDYITPISSQGKPTTYDLPAGGGDCSRHYEALRDTEKCGKLAEMIEQLQVMEKCQREFCDCGLPIDETLLPRGWSVHLSRDPDTLDQVYFMSPDDKSFWELPLPVCLDLSPEQQDKIRNLMLDSDLRRGGSDQQNALSHPLDDTNSYMSTLLSESNQVATDNRNSTSSSVSEDEGFGKSARNSTVL